MRMGRRLKLTCRLRFGYHEHIMRMASDAYIPRPVLKIQVLQSSAALLPRTHNANGIRCTWPRGRAQKESMIAINGLKSKYHSRLRLLYHKNRSMGTGEFCMGMKITDFSIIAPERPSCFAPIERQTAIKLASGHQNFKMQKPGSPLGRPAECLSPDKGRLTKIFA